jgi:hypothetical protein
VARTNRSSGSARITRSSSCRCASAERSSCTSSMTSQVRSSSGARSFSSRSAIAQPSRPGAADSGRTSFAPGSASATETQNRCGPRFSSCTETHATLSARPASPIQQRSRNAFPLPGGADI